MGRVVSLWSGPRNRSTALMYSVAQRPHVEVVDEPLFGHYLALTGANRPSRQEVLATQETDPAKLLPLLQPRERDVFLKHMACHLNGWSPDVFQDHFHVLLIREPEAVVRSYRKGFAFPTIEDLGYAWQSKWLHHCQANGWPVLVLDSDVLAIDPEKSLRALCGFCGWDWDECMMRWTAGPRPEDGVWAKYWYANVHASTGWSAPSNASENQTRPLNVHERKLVTDCQPHFDALRQHAMLQLK